jgi:D-sedoheptulose 7-phosphate isomerase
MSIIDERFQELVDLIPQFKKESKESIAEASKMMAVAFKNNNKILICGNGGSAADSQHFAAEFVNAFSRDITRGALPALALTTDTSVITSIANDFSFENIFSRQVQAYSNPGDILVVLTTSGSSINCINAVLEAKKVGVLCIALTRTEAEISHLVDLTIEVPSNNTQHIQECHILAYHVITELVEKVLFGGETLE